MVDRDEKYMQKALRLAQRGIGSVEPNPAVGCILVKGGQIVGKGWHRKFGGPHAEITALADCKTLGVNPKGSVMYVTLEPCCHEDKTGPCTDAIIAAGLKEVVIATIDPSEQVNGKGIKKLLDAEIEVKVGVCETEAKILNAPFIKFVTTGKSWVILKWAQSIDGKMAWVDEGDTRRWISNELSRKDVQKLRRRVDGVLVGIGTVLADNPSLTTRGGKGKKAIRVVLDSRLRIPLSCKLLKTTKTAPVLILTSQEAADSNNKAERIRQKGAELLVYPDTQGQSNLHFLLDELGKRGIRQLLVEGGPTVITSFLKEQLADEICVYITPKILGGAGSVDIGKPIAELNKPFELNYVDIKCFGDDVFIKGLSEKALKELSIKKTGDTSGEEPAPEQQVEETLPDQEQAQEELLVEETSQQEPDQQEPSEEELIQEEPVEQEAGEEELAQEEPFQQESTEEESAPDEQVEETSADYEQAEQDEEELAMEETIQQKPSEEELDQEYFTKQEQAEQDEEELAMEETIQQEPSEEESDQEYFTKQEQAEQDEEELAEQESIQQEPVEEKIFEKEPIEEDSLEQDQSKEEQLEDEQTEEERDEQ